MSSWHRMLGVDALALARGIITRKGHRMPPKNFVWALWIDISFYLGVVEVTSTSSLSDQGYIDFNKLTYILEDISKNGLEDYCLLEMITDSNNYMLAHKSFFVNGLPEEKDLEATTQIGNRYVAFLKAKVNDRYPVVGMISHTAPRKGKRVWEESDAFILLKKNLFL